LSTRNVLYGQIVYPAVVMLRGEGTVYSRLRRLQTLQWASAREISQSQNESLMKVLRHAASTVPYYRERFKVENISADCAQDLLCDLPFLEKKHLQRYMQDLKADGRYRVTRKTTGGSTGRTVTILKDRRATAAEMASTWLGYGWFGIRPGDKGVRFWGNPTTTRRKLRSFAADFVLNRKRFSAFAFDHADLDAYWDQCHRFRPDYLYGYVSMLEQLAEHVLRRDLPASLPGLKAVITTAEVLTEPQRSVLAKAFGVPVQNEYGCGEVGPIAYECPAGSLHVMSGSLVVEVINDQGQPAREGETGEIVITDLHNRAMPLVRYKVGDFGVRGGRCSCGRGLPTLERIWGRAYDFLIDSESRRYHGEFVMYLFEDLRAAGTPVDQFKVTQTGPEALRVDLVLPEAGIPGALEKVRAIFAERLPAFNVTLVEQQEIPRRKSGKVILVDNPWLRNDAAGIDPDRAV
jgi:phenylacetate-CoA ligase